MEDIQYIINMLAANKEVFSALLANSFSDEYQWQQRPDKWSLLEIVCHLRDEEKEDFRTRIQFIFDSPDTAPPAIDPPGWVEQRNYNSQDFDKVVHDFITEREHSIIWITDLQNPDWLATCNLASYSDRSAKLYLTNWLAHDYLHIKQITRLRYDYLHHSSGLPLEYAGKWV